MKHCVECGKPSDLALHPECVADAIKKCGRLNDNAMLYWSLAVVELGSALEQIDNIDACDISEDPTEFLKSLREKLANSFLMFEAAAGCRVVSV